MDSVDVNLRSLLLHDAFVRRIARGVTDPASVDDVVQETWWIALKRRTRASGSMKPWLAKVARRLALNSRRAETRRGARELRAAKPETISSTATLVEREAARKHVVECVLGLPEPLRGTIVLRYFEGLPPREIARSENVPVETVRSRLKRAFSILRAELAPVDAEEHAAFGTILAAIAHGPQAPAVAGVAAASGNAVLLGAFVMSTGTKTVAAIAAFLLLVGIVLVPMYLTSDDRAAQDVTIPPPSSDTPPRAPQGEPTAPIHPRPYSENDTAASAPSATGALEVEVVGQRAPAAGARLVLHREKKIIAQAITNADGIGVFRSGEGNAELIVFPEGAPAHFASIELLPGRRRVQLPGGRSIVGRVECNGAPPTEPVKLAFISQTESEVDPRLARLREALKASIHPRCRVAPSGEFEITGLPEGSKWRLIPAGEPFEAILGTTTGYQLDEVMKDGEPTILLTAPTSGVLVKLRRVPVVRGRVVSGDPPVPVAKARVEVTLSTPGNNSMIYLDVAEDGRFIFPVESRSAARDRVWRLKFVIGGPFGVGAREIVLDPAPDRDHDLGDVVLPTARTIRYVVRDRGGRPIEGAVAGARYEVDPASRTNAEGQGAIRVSPNAASFNVGALRYEVVQVAIPSPLPDPLPVVLEPSGGVEVRVSTQPPSAAAFLRIRMTAQVEVVTGTRAIGNDEIHVAAGASKILGGSRSRDGTVFELAPVDGKAVLAGLKPGVPLTITAIDALDHPLAQTVVSLDAAEWKTVELEVRNAARTLRGRVIDSARKAVPNARVTFIADPNRVGAYSAQDGRDLFARTDEAGRFVFDALFMDVAHFLVNKNGFVPMIRRDFALPTGDVDLELVLQRGSDFVVKVVDSRGAAITDIASVSADVDGYPRMTATQQRPGEYVFSDFPADVFATIRMGWADREWSRVVAVRVDHVEVVKMPPAGTLVVDYTGVGPAAPDDSPLDLVLEWGGETPGAEGHGLPSPGPFDRGVVELPLIPGEYRVTLRFGPRDASGSQRTLTESVGITAGETTRVVFQKK